MSPEQTNREIRPGKEGDQQGYQAKSYSQSLWLNSAREVLETDSTGTSSELSPSGGKRADIFIYLSGAG